MNLSPKVAIHKTNIELNLQPDRVSYIQSAALPDAVERNLFITSRTDKDGVMKSAQFLAQKGVQFILFLVAFFLFLWPFPAAAYVAEPKAMFLYLFSAWALVIVMLFFISRACRDLSEHNKAQTRSIE